MQASRGNSRLGATITDQQLEVLDPEVGDGRVRWTAVLRTRERGEQRAWFSVDERHQGELVPAADPFVVALLREAVVHGRTLRIDGAPTSPSLLSNLEELQRVWRQWYGTPVVELRPEAVEERRPADGGALAAFSGGIDSSYTLYRHVRRRAGWRAVPVRAAVFVHGFDIPLRDAEGFEGATRRARRMCDSLGVELITLRTNIRSYTEPWPEFHGAALAGALSAVGGRASMGLIGSSATYGSLILRWGSTPVTDSLCGGRAFPIVHDGAGATRAEKLKLLAEWPEAMRWIRVCWAGPRNDRNCGRCRKCVTVALMCRTLGIQPGFYEQPVSERSVIRAARTAPTDEFSDHYRNVILDLAAEEGIDEPWVRVMRRAQLRYGLRRAWADVRRSPAPRGTVMRPMAARFLAIARAAVRRRTRRGVSAGPAR